MTLGSNRTPEITGRDVILALFRITISGIVATFQIAPESTLAWESIWQDNAWQLADKLDLLGLPQAKWLGAAVLVTISLACLGLGFGFLTRLSSLVLALYSATFIGYIITLESDVSQLELAIVYCTSFFYFVFHGPGNLSADYFFRRPKQTPRSFS